MFQTTLPSVGCGYCVPRDKSGYYADDEKAEQEMPKLFLPQQEDFYKATVDECLESDIVVDSFLAPPANYFIDVATQSYVLSIPTSYKSKFPECVTFSPQQKFQVDTRVLSV